MPIQKAAFLGGEADKWFIRNASSKYDADDSVIRALSDIHLPRDSSILEIGCGGGGRLALLRGIYKAECHGIEPSMKAVEQARRDYPELNIVRGTADSLPYRDSAFDVVVFGFCLYLCDPSDHFRIVCEADRVLADGSLLVIYDFAPPQPFSNDYHHAPGLRAYKMQWAKMFLGHPAYRHLIRKYTEQHKPFTFHPNDMTAVDIVRKDRSTAFPPNRGG